jgi:hypothetical protein
MTEEACLDLRQVGVLVEERHFVAVGYPHFALASLTLEARDRHEPSPTFDCRVAAVLTSKRELHVPQPIRKRHQIAPLLAGSTKRVYHHRCRELFCR